MKKFFNKFLSVLIQFNRARAASILARQGHIDSAKRMMTEENSKC